MHSCLGLCPENPTLELSPKFVSLIPGRPTGLPPEQVPAAELGHQGGRRVRHLNTDHQQVRGLVPHLATDPLYLVLLHLQHRVLHLGPVQC